MSSVFVFGCLATGLAVAVLLVADRAGDRPRVAIAKPLASLGFLVAAWGAGALESRYGQTIFAGLVLCLLGDVLLIPKSRWCFLGGLASFLLGHVAFAVGCLVRGIALPAAIAAVVALVPAAAMVWRWLGPNVDRGLRVPVLAYITVITAMVALAAGSVWHRASWTLAAGAVGFYLSDLSVARDRFVVPAFVNRAWGLPLYYAAQLLLAASTASG